MRIPIAKVRETVSFRTLYDPETLMELAASVQKVGLLQPILVRKGSDGMFDLIAGSRRLRAERHNGKNTILAIIVKKTDDRSALIMALSENLHRDNFTPFEEAALFMKLVRDHDMGEQQIAEAIGRKIAYVHQRLMILKLPKEVQILISKGKLSLAQVEVLQKLPTADEQVRIGNVIAQSQLTSADARLFVNNRGGRPTTPLSTQRRYVKEFSPLKILTRVERAARFLAHLSSELERFNLEDRKKMQGVLATIQETIQGLLNSLGGRGKGGHNGGRS